MVPFVSLWKDLMRFSIMGGDPVLARIVSRPSLLTRSKALARPMQATPFSAPCTFLDAVAGRPPYQFVDLSAQKPHWLRVDSFGKDLEPGQDDSGKTEE